MDKLLKNNQTFDEKLQEIGTKILVRRYNLDHRPINSLSDIFFYIREYNTQYEYYLNDLKHNRCNVSDEAHFVFNLSFIDAIKFTALLHCEFGFLYYPGINGSEKDTFYNSRYYEVKKEFVGKKYHIPYMKPKAKVSYILYPSEEFQDINFDNPQVENCDGVDSVKSDINSKLDNYFDDPSRFFTFDDGYNDGYSRTKTDK